MTNAKNEQGIIHITGKAEHIEVLAEGVEAYLKERQEAQAARSENTTTLTIQFK